MEPVRKVTMRLPLSMILMLLVQASAILVWATQLDARVAGIEQLGANGHAVNEKLAKLEARMEDVKEGMGEIKHQLDRLTEFLLKH